MLPFGSQTVEHCWQRARDHTVEHCWQRARVSWQRERLSIAGSVHGHLRAEAHVRPRPGWRVEVE